MQEPRDGAETWMVYSTNIDYLTINIWGPEGLGHPCAHKEIYILRGSSISGGVPTFMSAAKGDKRGLTYDDSHESPTAPHHNTQRNFRVPLLVSDFIQKK